MSGAMNSKLERNIGWVVLLILMVGCLQVLRPFLSALLWAVAFGFIGVFLGPTVAGGRLPVGDQMVGNQKCCASCWFWAAKDLDPAGHKPVRGKLDS